MRLPLLIVLGAALLLSTRPTLADDTKDQDGLQGIWEVTSLFADGKPEGIAKIRGTTLVIKGDKITLSASEGKVNRHFKFKLDSAKKPKTIDALAQDGAAEGKTIRGIYDVKEDIFTWSMSREPDGRRPTDLAPKDGDMAMILTAKRAKP